MAIWSAEGVPGAAIMVEALRLSPREREVAARVTRGLGTEEIAADLFLSPHTARDYLKAFLEMVGVSSRGELVATLLATRWESERDVRHVTR